MLWARERGREREEVEKRGTMTQRRRRRRNFDKRGERTHRLLSAIGVFSFAMLLLLLLEEDARAGTAATGRVESTRKGGIFGLRSRVGVFFPFFSRFGEVFFFPTGLITSRARERIEAKSEAKSSRKSGKLRGCGEL